MEKNFTPKATPHSLARSGPGVDSFTVFNVEAECPEISYNQILETPRLLQIISDRSVSNFSVQFSTEKDCKDFQKSSFGQDIQKNLKRQTESSVPGYIAYNFSHGKRISYFLREVARFHPIEVTLGVQGDKKKKPVIKAIRKTNHAKEEPKEKKETEYKEDVFKVRSAIKSRQNKEVEEDPEPVKKFKNGENQYVNVMIHQELVRSQGDLRQIINTNPELGEKILSNLEHFGKLERHVQSKIKQDIFQDWQVGIQCNEISLHNIEQSLKDKSLGLLSLKREVFFEKKDDLKRLEQEKISEKIPRKK